MIFNEPRRLRNFGNDMPGYLSSMYAKSFSEFGNPRHLGNSNGWIIERQVPGSERLDGMGCYPLFCCTDWSRLPEDLQELRSELVSLALVTDPFGSFDPAVLASQFDVVAAFKDHYVVDLSLPLERSVKRSHRDTVRRALKTVRVRVCPDPAQYFEKWVELFSHLVHRHSIGGLRAFSRKSFEYQLKTPGLVMFDALVDGETVGLDLWYVKDDIAYGHLVAFNDAGYRNRASYATKWTMLNYFRDKVRWVDLGGVPGPSAGKGSGLDSFKKGWATDTRPTYFCGAVLDPDAYEKLTRENDSGATSYFPAYRTGEFS